MIEQVIGVDCWSLDVGCEGWSSGSTRRRVLFRDSEKTGSFQDSSVNDVQRCKSSSSVSAVSLHTLPTSNEFQMTQSHKQK